MRALDPARYDITPIGITHDGRWLTAGDPMARLAAGDASTTPGADNGSGRELVPGATGARLPALDVIFPVLHGPYGEDGTVQGLLELADLPYVGCGVLAGALGMDKIAAKHVYLAAGLPVAAFVALTRRDWETTPETALDHIEATLGYPVFVKPANLGSSIGIGKAADRAGLAAALDEAARYDRRLLIEDAVPHAREIECSVLGNDDPIASVPGEVVPSNEFYDYNAKYIDGDSQLLIPASLPAETARHIRELAVQAFQAVDGAGLARVDFLVNGDTHEMFLNEINTMPGFTDISMYPKLWEATGLPYPRIGRSADRIWRWSVTLTRVARTRRTRAPCLPQRITHKLVHGKRVSPWPAGRQQSHHPGAARKAQRPRLPNGRRKPGGSRRPRPAPRWCARKRWTRAYHTAQRFAPAGLARGASTGSRWAFSSPSLRRPAARPTASRWSRSGLRLTRSRVTGNRRLAAWEVIRRGAGHRAKRVHRAGRRRSPIGCWRCRV